MSEHAKVAPGPGAVVETRSGRVRGSREDGAFVFRGIPYAAPPVGPLRFRPPGPPAPWSGVRDALRAGASAPQLAGALAQVLGQGGDGQSEDCLALDVFTPGADGARRPVLVWLHGGGFTSGAGSQAVYHGGSLARRGDVVVVTLNYRLGILGWLALPELAEEGGAGANFGLLDQLAALAWVRDNVAAFGGDPENVTLFGESAGAMSIGALLGCPRARGLFQRAILQSGAAHHVHSSESAAAVTAAVLDALGLGPHDVGALRALPVDAILAAQKRVLETFFPDTRLLRFQPAVDGDVLPRPPLEAIAEGSAAGIAVLAGTNLDEYRLWGLADPKLAALDDAALVRRCRRTVPGEHPSEGPHGERVVRAYREARADVGDATDPQALWFAIESDRIFRVPATRLLDAQAPHAPATHAYLFTWASPALGGRLGACHALEIPFVFGHPTHPLIRGFVGDDPAAEALSAAMQDAWLAFARGEPPADWPAYDAARRATRIFGRESGVAERPRERERAFWQELL
jgi:para-nitrobenzyl esterase